MKNKGWMYILLGVLLGVIVVLGAVFYRYENQLKDMERQVASMEKTMKESLAKVQSGETVSETEMDLDAAYVGVDEKEAAAASKKKKKTAESPEPPEPSEPDAAEEFDQLKPTVETMLEEFQAQTGGTWSVYVENLDSGGSMEVKDEKMKAASLIKLYIMGAVYENYEELSQNANLDGLLASMIKESDNEAANELLKLLGSGSEGGGMDKVNSFCVQYNYTSTSMGRVLLAENPTGENYTSVADCGKFLYHVYNGKFKNSEKMLELLKGQTRRSKIPAAIPDGIEVANKTGELDDVQNDAAIVFGETPYIICVMSQGVSGEEGPVSAIVKLSDAVYGYTNQS